jgi:hypothetical protein
MIIPITFAALVSGEERGSMPTTAQEYLYRGEERAGAHYSKGAIADYNAALRLRLDYGRSL